MESQVYENKRARGKSISICISVRSYHYVREHTSLFSST